MARGIARLVSGRRAHRRATPAPPDADELCARARRSYQETERALHDWHVFVDGRQRGLRTGPVRAEPVARPPAGLGS